MHCRKTGCMFYKMTKDGKRIAPVQNKPKKAAVVEVKKGGAAKQRLTIWSLIHAVWLSTELLWGSQLLTALEGDLVAYHRCLRVLEVPQETAQIVDSFDSSNYPEKGKIEFRKYYLKYRPETEPRILKNVSY